MGRLEKKKLINTLYCYGGERGIVIWGVINIFRLSFDKIDFDKGVRDVEMTPKATPCDLWAESICANCSFEKVLIAPLSFILMVLIAPINEMK